MSISFSGSELINIAIDIERRGVAFYDTMARSTESAATGDAFRYLADMERQHIQTFQDMLTEADKLQLLESYTQEHAAYLVALVDSAVFTDDLATGEMVTRTDSDIEALELAISAEKDSVLFYYEMRDIMPRPTHPTINRIIAEEKSHLRQLSQLKKGLSR